MVAAAAAGCCCPGARIARFHRAGGKAGAGRGQYQHRADRARAREHAANAESGRGRPVLRVLPPLHAAESRPVTARVFNPLAGFGLHHQRRRLHPYQRARRRWCRRDHGTPHRQARIQGQGHRRRQAHRRGADQDRGDRAPHGQAGRSEQAQGGRMGAGDRFAFRFRQHRHRRHRQRQGPLAAAGKPGALHPDRRRGEPGQLGRPAVQHARRGGRHQLADLQPHRRLHGAVVRHSRSTSRWTCRTSCAAPGASAAAASAW